MISSLVVLLVALCCSATVLAENLNGEYIISNAAGDYNTNYTARYFTVYSNPIETQYSEVYWTVQQNIPLPEDILKQFSNSTIAIVGYEANQVRRLPNGTEVFVPIWQSYNHHYEAWIVGAYASFAEDKSVPEGHSAYGMMDHGGARFTARSLDTDPYPNSSIPTSQFFSEGNGGEYRKSFHGYPPGYAQLIDSPRYFNLQPMQIDTHNRDFPDADHFIPGPEPRSSTAPPNATASGLLECPCTTRITKQIQITYSTQTTGTCATPVTNATECFHAATTVGIAPSDILANTTVSSPAYPRGCSLVPNGKGQYTVLANDVSQGTGAKCGSGGSSDHVHGSVSVAGIVTITVDLVANSGSGGAQGVATITMTGLDGVWFGVGFNASVMGDLPYVIVVNGTGGVEEHKLADHAAGINLNPTVTIVSNTVRSGVRTTIIQRALQGATSDYYSFNPQTGTDIPIIAAVGNTPNFAYHANKAAGNLVLSSVSSTTCVCDVGEKGSINGIPFSKNCAAEPRGDLAQQGNPTCSIRTYQGGLSCCHHGWFLLDADQQVPEPTDTIYLVFRFYYETYDPTYHKNLVRFYTTTEAYAGEYDVPQAPAGTPPESRIHTITAHFQVKELINPCPVRKDSGCTGQPTQGIELIYIGGHCHAPTCMDMELYNADTGDLICRQEAVFGNSGQVFDEAGYLALPPCLFGYANGLIKPTLLGLEANLFSIVRCNSTYPHYGNMASWQMRGITV